MRYVWLLTLWCGCGPAATTPDDAGSAADLAGVAPDLAGADLPGADLAGSPLSALDDEFDNPATLASWSDAFPSRHDLLDIGASRAGFLTLQPAPNAFNHWYSDSQGPYLYKQVTGNFVVETSLRIGRRSDMTLAPQGQFNAAGFVVRSPASSSPGGQRWVMYNLGMQDGALARESKSTVANPGGASLSSLYLNDAPAGATTVRLRVCRVGNVMRFHYRFPADAGWTAEPYAAGSTRNQGNGAGTVSCISGNVLACDRADLPATLDVGIIVGTWSAPLEARGEFDYVRFREAQTAADCTASF
jgi:hypothetical protein